MQTTYGYDEETAAIEELSQALRAIHDRLIAERYTIVDGTYVPPKKDSN